MQICLEVSAQLLTERQTNNNDYITFLVEVIKGHLHKLLIQRLSNLCYKLTKGQITKENVQMVNNGQSMSMSIDQLANGKRCYWQKSVERHIN